MRTSGESLKSLFALICSSETGLGIAFPAGLPRPVFLDPRRSPIPRSQFRPCFCVPRFRRSPTSRRASSLAGSSRQPDSIRLPIASRDPLGDRRRSTRMALSSRDSAWKLDARVCCLVPRQQRWRRGESNPRPRSLATRRLHAYPVPMISPLALRMGKTRHRLVR